jgi:hypothetical protein
MALLEEDTARRLALAVAAGRTGLGVTALIAPRLVAQPWIGEAAAQPLVKVLARALGGRDLALGLGALLAARHDQRLRGWVEAAALADLVDAAVTVAAFAKLPRWGRLVVLVGAGGAAAAGAVLARSV